MSKKSGGYIGSFLKEKRLSLGLKLNDIAQAVGSTPQFIVNIENGRAPLPSKMVRPVMTVLQIPEKEMLKALIDESKAYWEEQFSKKIKRSS